MENEISFPSFLFPHEDVEEHSDDPLAYLLDKLTVKDIVSELSKKLHHPIGLVDYKALMNQMTSDKIESMVGMYPMRTSCSIFRKCAGESYCTQCDCFHARCMNTKIDIIKNNIKTQMDHVPDFFSPKYFELSPQVLEGYNRPIIEYRCPMLGYRELLFPLKYKDEVYGVLFAGQIMVYSDNDYLINKDIRDNFFIKKIPEELFKTFVEEFNNLYDGTTLMKLNCRKIQELIASSDRSLQPYDTILGFKQLDKGDLGLFSKNFYTRKSYTEFINKVCQTIAETEMTISDAYKERRKIIISKVLRQTTDVFYDECRKVYARSFSNNHEERTEELKNSWNALKIFANEIKRKFVFVEKIYVFGDGQNIRIEDSGEKGIVFAIPSEEIILAGSFNFTSSEIDGISDCDDSLTNPDILSGLSKELEKENGILVRCNDIAMMLVLTDQISHQELLPYFVEAVGKELVRINNFIALCSANLMKEKYLLTLRMYRHENAHISNRLMDDINRYFENSGQRFLKAEEEKRRLVCNDMRNTVQLISNIADNLSFVTGTGIAVRDPQEEVIIFDIVDMLYKWQIMFRDVLVARNLEINVCRGGYDPSSIGYKMAGIILRNSSELITRQSRKLEEAPREIRINARLFELLVYNLVDNAVKYAYRGTNIYLIWGKFENDYELSVTSYGPRMPDGDTMYGLYARGKDERSISGDGLGLYIVKKIANKLNLNVSHDGNEMFSRFNVPLISWYIKTDFSGVKSYEKIDESILIQDLDPKQIDLITNDYPSTKIKERDLTDDYLRSRINLETWRTTFIVRIPIKSQK